MANVRMLSVEWNYHCRVAMTDRDALLFLGIMARSKIIKRTGYNGPYEVDDEERGQAIIDRAEVVEVILPDDEAQEVKTTNRTPIVDARTLP